MTTARLSFFLPGGSPKFFKVFYGSRGGVRYWKSVVA